MEGSPQTWIDRITHHIKKDSVRTKVRDGLSAFLNDLEEACPDSTRQDDDDGVVSILPEMFVKREKARFDSLKTLFPKGVVPVAKFMAESDDVNGQGQFGYTRLIQAVVDHDTALVQQLLSNPKVDRSIRDTGGQTALDKALNRGYDDIIELFEPSGS